MTGTDDAIAIAAVEADHHPDADTLAIRSWLCRLLQAMQNDLNHPDPRRRAEAIEFFESDDRDPPNDDGHGVTFLFAVDVITALGGSLPPPERIREAALKRHRSRELAARYSP